jgi:PH (Pleckstrin Homology) domain-containing protein
LLLFYLYPIYHGRQLHTSALERDTTVYRPDITAGEAGAGIVLGVFALTSIGHLWRVKLVDGSLSVGLQVLAFGAFFVLTAAMWRATLTELRVEATGVLVRNLFSTRRFAWKEIESFNLVTKISARRLPGVYVKAKDGQCVPVRALRPDTIGRHTEISTILDRLNSRLSS